MIAGGLVSSPDIAFQKAVLQLSAAGAQGISGASTVQRFCRLARESLRLDGAYIWKCLPNDELLLAEADGVMAEQVRGTLAKAGESTVAIEAVRRHKTFYVNHVDPDRYPRAAQLGALAAMATPLVVAGEVVGAATLIHCSDPDFFNDAVAGKATILAGQLGSLLEAEWLSRASREERRRGEILAEVAQALPSGSDPGSVLEAVADRLRVLLRTRLVCVMLRQDSTYLLRAVAAESPQLAAAARARHDRKGLHFAADLAHRAVAAGELISVTIDPATHALGDLIPAGMLIAAPLRTSLTQGAVLVYPRQSGAFTGEERLLVSTVAGFGAVAVANAELLNTARGQAHELQQLLEISSELGSIGQFDDLLQRFVLRAADFLGFGRAFVGLLEQGEFRVHWGAERGRTRRAELVFPEGTASHALLNKEVFWTDDAGKVKDANLQGMAGCDIRQLLAVPFLGTDGQVRGMFGVLDRLDRAGISQEDIRRARALAAQVAVALEVAHNLYLIGQHRCRTEAPAGSALTLSFPLRLPDLATALVRQAAEMLETTWAALAIRQESGLEAVALRTSAGELEPGHPLLRSLEHALAHASPPREQTIITARASDLLGPALALELGGDECTLVRLDGSSAEPLGVLCLGGYGRAAAREQEHLLQAIASQASKALENSRLFSRMNQANQHWIEIFDAIGDYIVAHDDSDRVLRVNRALADFIGVPPQELIGLNMGALLAIDHSPPLRSCPFCRSLEESTDEYVHPVLERTYLVSTSRVHGANGGGMQTIHVLKDISDRQEAERRYREIFDNIQEGLFFATLDGRFIEVNDALVRMLGYSSREALLQADIRNHVFDSADRYKKLAEQMQQHGGVRNHEETLRRHDGSLVFVLINAFAVHDTQGRVAQYRGVMLDISGLRSFQAELQRERDFSGKILNHTQSLILVADTAGLVSYANRRWYELGYQQSDLLGRPLEELVVSAKRQVLNDALRTTIAGGQVDNLDLQIQRGDGRIGQFSANLSPMRDEQGNVTSLVVVMTDVTDAAMLQSQLMQSAKMAALGQLVSGVAHEVNNPLTAILGFADLLMENPEVPESARKDLRVILQEAQRTKQIVQSLLHSVRQMPPQRKPVQVNLIVRRTVQLRSYDFQSHGIQVIEQLDHGLPPVIGDAQQLQQVFLNILNNAYDAVRETGRPARIEIRTARLSNLVEISFRDNGQGIANPERIFDPFFTTKEVGKGTGLGLSICYGIVREHGGEILCHNNPDGEGATFIVRLPVTSEVAASGAAAGVIQA